MIGPHSLTESNNMKSNVGGIDRTLRIVIGLALIAATLMGMLPVWGWIGVVPLVTGLIGWCAPYAIFGLSTCSSCETED